MAKQGEADETRCVGSVAVERRGVSLGVGNRACSVPFRVVGNQRCFKQGPLIPSHVQHLVGKAANKQICSPG